MTDALTRAARAAFADGFMCNEEDIRAAILSFLSGEDVVEIVANAVWVAQGDSAPNEQRAFLRGAQEPHDGDCTGQSYGCGACTCIMALDTGRAVIAALRALVQEDGK